MGETGTDRNEAKVWVKIANAIFLTRTSELVDKYKGNCGDSITKYV